jgi:hypothetical protein
MAKNQLNLDPINVAIIKVHLEKYGERMNNQAVVDFAMEFTAKNINKKTFEQRLDEEQQKQK